MVNLDGLAVGSLVCQSMYLPLALLSVFTVGLLSGCQVFLLAVKFSSWLSSFPPGFQVFLAS
jgi:hypothetical protein